VRRMQPRRGPDRCVGHHPALDIPSGLIDFSALANGPARSGCWFERRGRGTTSSGGTRRTLGFDGRQPLSEFDLAHSSGSPVRALDISVTVICLGLAEALIAVLVAGANPQLRQADGVAGVGRG
jgi:hypothetical protein